ncbi:hypothetical protein GU3_12730 [Oceanimonas sp. GK1]|uniref:hypothetical protein n=1 Tax=Oceanimonas sp. (strain GK1 / IBRC-M 10197) TaxID=511062 RepID=UPI00024951B9|nr:hypothetical protein [Oceanimonas sp. GK1]AEY02301.1 hypothetical protein GU3_12730 [Oceanimonas sp. GK1]
MAKVITVMLQGVGYHWNGQDILVDDGISLPWSLAGSSLEQIELYDREGETTATFSIDFERQDWSLAGESEPGEVILVDDRGAALSALSPLAVQAMLLPASPLMPEAMPGAAGDDPPPLSLDDILLSSELPDMLWDATLPDTAGLDSDLIDDVINWLSVYSPPE